MAERSIVLRALEALKKACKDLQSNRATAATTSSACSSDADVGDRRNSASMKALLELETKSDRLLFGDPNLSTLSHLLCRLRSLSLQNRKAGSSFLFFLPPTSFFRRSGIETEISEVAGSIESEIQSWIDRESLHRLTVMLKAQDINEEEGEILSSLCALESCLSRGFDKKLQSSILTSRTFEAVESTLVRSAASNRLKEACAAAIASMVEFNRDVFVGLLLLGGSVGSLLDISTPAAISTIRLLVTEVKMPLVDEMDAKGEISRVVGLVGVEDEEMGVAAAEVLLEVGYYGRKETLGSMMEDGVVERLVELQRRAEGEEGMTVEGVHDVEERRRIGRWVARFAIQVEVGDGLLRREKNWFKVEVLKRVNKAAISKAEEATIAAEVLWGAWS